MRWIVSLNVHPPEPGRRVGVSLRSLWILILVAHFLPAPVSVRGSPGAASANYTLLHQSVDQGGGRVQGSRFAMDLSFGTVGGLSRAAGATLQQGYVGQINDAPWIAIQSPTALTRTNAVVRSQVNPNAYEATVRLEYGRTRAYDNVLPLPSLPADAGAQTVNALLAGLTPGAEYHYRWVASNADGTVQSADAVFNTAVNHPPSARPDFIERQAGRSVKVILAKLLANDPDADGDPLGLSALDATSAANATISVDGAWVIYMPPPEFNSTDTFSYTASDGYGGSAIGVVTVLVAPDPDPFGRTQVRTDFVNGTELKITFAGIPGRAYSIEASASLTPPDWQSLGTATANSRGLYEFIDVNAGQFPTRFYRAVPQ